MAIDLKNVKNVVETYQLQEVNKYLEWGYLLIDTAGGRWQDSKEPLIVYSLGWTRDEPAPKLPDGFV